MRKSKAVVLGFKHFDEEGDAIAFLNGMLLRYEVGSEVSKPDAVVLEAALARHPDASEIGAAAIGFSVRTADFGSKSFWVDRADGSAARFSHKACTWYP